MMVSVMFCIQTIALLLLSVLVGISISLKCYICHTDDNSLCTDDFLQECPKNQAYDRCMTTLYKNAKDGLHIKKECTLAPCHLRDPSLKFINFHEECDSSKTDCVYCCPEDGCNKDGASNICIKHFFTLFVIISLVLLINQYLHTYH